jgi:hypothetical protein
LSAPFLGSIASRAAKAQAPAAPKRLIAMFTHYGCVTTRFFPAKSHGPLTASDLAPTTLKHLAPFVDKLLIPRGIRGMNEWTRDMVRGQGNDPYLQVVGSYLTCQPVTPNSDNPFSFDPATKFNAMPIGRSLDHVIAEQLSPDGAPLFMRVGNVKDSPATGISYSAPETPFPGLGSPLELFRKLTGLFQGDSLSPDSYQAIRGKSMIDLVRHDLETLQRYDMSQSDRTKLEAWKTLLHETTSVMVAAQCNAEVAATFGLTQANISALSGQHPNGDALTTKVTDTLDGADIYSSLAALAAICNVNPMIVLKYPTNFVFKGLGINVESASLSRRANSAAMSGDCLANAIQLILTIDDYYARKFGHLVSLLNGIGEGDGTLLDNTAAVWFQEVSDGCARNLNNLPIIQAGSLGGYFKTGWAVNVEDGSPTLTRGNSEAQCTPDTTTTYNALDQETGTDPRVAIAPINKYYCSLMNALGVKANDNGFPQKGGSERVARFGRYDRTEDFVHGGTAPPAIHDPGEFTALRAR